MRIIYIWILLVFYSYGGYIQYEKEISSLILGWLKSNSSTNWKMFDFFFWSSWCTMRVNRELALCTSEDGISWWLESMDCLFGNKRAKFHRRSMGVIVTPPCKNWFFIFSLHVSRQKLGWNFMIDRFLSFTLIFFWLQSVSTDMKWY